MTKLEFKIDLLVKLADYIKKMPDPLKAATHRTYYENKWLTVENQELALFAIADKMLNKTQLAEWTSKYTLTEEHKPKTVGLILAGNIPVVGFHDWLCTFISGHQAMIKPSDKDKYVLPHLIGKLEEWSTKEFINTIIVTTLSDFDAVIATGSNNSARYFESYFGKYPNIIRKNRNSIAILTGNESSEDLNKLGQDVFQYFGLGCRNVSKIYVPKGYDFEVLLEAFHSFREIVLHHKYKNNFDYNFALLTLNRTNFLNNGCITLIEDERLTSRISSLHYEYYEDEAHLAKAIHEKADEIQAIVTGKPLEGITSVPFGKAQQPELWDYADGVDTMNFLLDL